MILKMPPAKQGPQTVSQLFRTKQPQQANASVKPDAKKLLFGSGLRSRDAARAEREFVEMQKRDSSLQKLPSIDDLATVMEVNLPTTLVSDDLKLDESQEAARAQIVVERFGCIIGAAGTGKTTTVKAILHSVLQNTHAPKVAFGAFTGRAVQQIKRALPREFHEYCDTIHGLLEYAPEEEERDADTGKMVSKNTRNLKIIKIFKPQRTATNPLDENVIIVDEAGMMPIDLWNNLVAACRPGTRIILIGDINQLPPVQGRSVLGFAMLKWPTFELNRIHRTNEDAITDGAWNILHGKTPRAVQGKVVLKEVSNSSLEAWQQTIAIVQRLHQNGTFHPLRDALIVPQNVGNIGQEAFNEKLALYFNPPIHKDGILLNPRVIITSGVMHHAFAIGDKVMVTANDRQQGLTNGMIGVIEKIVANAKFEGEAAGDMAGAMMDEDFTLDVDELESQVVEIERKQTAVEEDSERQASHIITVRFQNVEEPITFATAGAVNALRHAYAFTCHKAQGGEYENIVILLHSANLNMLSREWLYTAWTRAKQKVILLYNTRGLTQALNRQVIRGKTLEEKARAFNALQERNSLGDSGIKVPELPAPERVA